MALSRFPFEVSLLDCFATAVVSLHSSVPEFTTTPGDKPRVSDFVRLQAAAGLRITNRQHRSLGLDDLMRQVLQCLDGQHDVAQITDAILDRIESGELLLHRDEKSTDEATRELIAQDVRNVLQALAEQAVIVE